MDSRPAGNLSADIAVLRAAPEIPYNRAMPPDMPAEFFRRVDDSDDPLFYSFPRFVVHIDEWAIRTIGEIFAQRLPHNGVLLDLMSSWRSHLPPILNPVGVTGLGLNRAEMQDNPALTEVTVHDLNREPRLPFADASFDGAILTVSVQYMIRPVEVFADVGRVLRPAAPFVVSFSNRMFPTKAVWVWQRASEPQRVELVRRYFGDSGMFEDIDSIERHSDIGPADPVYAVIGIRRR
jgi:SAM-dependent methyltransferase